MGWKEKFQKLPDSTKVRLIFHPVALAATQLVSLNHYIFIPNAHYFTPTSVIAGLILGGAIAAAAEIANRYLAQKERTMQENGKIVKLAINPLKTHLYVVEVLPDGEVVYRFANDAYAKRPNRAHYKDLAGVKYSDFHTPEESAAFYSDFAQVIKAGIPLRIGIY